MRRWLVSLVFVLFAFAPCRPAHAADREAPSSPSTASGGTGRSGPRLRSWHGPFDPEGFRYGSALGGGLIAARRTNEATSELGLELAVGVRSETQVGPFTLVGGPQAVVRSLGPADIFLTLPRNVILGGVRVGPVGVDGGFGLSVVTVDFSRSAFGIGVLSPVASVGVTLTVGGARLRAGLATEYLWRLNAENVLLRSATLTLYP